MVLFSSVKYISMCKLSLCGVTELRKENSQMKFYAKIL